MKGKPDGRRERAIVFVGQRAEANPPPSGLTEERFKLGHYSLEQGDESGKLEDGDWLRLSHEPSETLSRNYRERKLCIHLHFGVGNGQNDLRNQCLVFQQIRIRNKSESVWLRPSGPKSKTDVHGLLDGRNYWNYSMLVPDVKVMHGPEGLENRLKVTVRSVEWLQGFDKCLSLPIQPSHFEGTTSPYWLPLFGEDSVAVLVQGKVRARVEENRELRPFWWRPRVLYRELPSDVVESRSQVVHHIAENYAPSFDRGIGGMITYPKPMRSAIPLRFSNSQIGVGFEEGFDLRRKFVNVLTRPAYLGLRVIEWVSHADLGP